MLILLISITSAGLITQLPASTLTAKSIDTDKPLMLTEKSESTGSLSSVYIDGSTVFYYIKDFYIGTTLQIPDAKQQFMKTDEKAAANELKYQTDTISLKYEAHESWFKEYIEVQDPKSMPTGYSYVISGNGYSLQENKDEINIIDPVGIPIVVIERPYAIDADGTRYDLAYKLEKGMIFLSGIEKLIDAKYPIIIDPSYRIITGIGVDQLAGPMKGTKTARTSTGRLWTTWKSPTVSGVAPINASYSDDGGVTWTTETVIDTGVGANALGDLLTDSADDLYVIFAGTGGGTNTSITNLRMRIRNASTNTWGSIQQVTDNTRLEYSPGWGTIYPACTLNQSDYIHCIYTTHNTTNLYTNTMSQEGYTYRKAGPTGTWSSQVLITDNAASPPHYTGSIVVDSQDTLHVAWTGHNWPPSFGAFTILYRYKPITGQWNGSSFRSGTEVIHQSTGTPLMTNFYPQLAVNSTNYVYIAYTGASSAQFNPLYFRVRNPSTGVWSTARNLSIITSTTAKQFVPTVGVDAGDNVTFVSPGTLPAFYPTWNLSVWTIPISTGVVSTQIFLTTNKFNQQDPHLFNRKYPIINSVSPGMPAIGYGFVWGNNTGASTGEVWFWNTTDLRWPTPSLPPVSGFSCSPTSGTAPIDVTCIDASTGGAPTSWSWNVENGSYSKTATVKNPIFNMSFAGSYNVNLSVTNGVGSSWNNKTEYLLIQNTAPTVIWNLTPLFGNLTQMFNFVDTSTGINVTAWNWSFGDGNVSALRNITGKKFPCIFDLCQYDINLSVTDSGPTLWNISNWLNRSAYANIFGNSSPTVSFIGIPLTGAAPLSVSFTAYPAGSIKIDSYTWVFGDMGTSQTTFDSVNKQYLNPGIYTVTLNAVNFTLGNTTVTKTGYIVVTSAPSGECPVNVTNTTILAGNIVNTTYIQNDGYIPIEIWAVLAISGLAFLILSLLMPQRIVILGVTAVLLLGSAAAASLLLVINSEMLTISPLINKTILNITVIQVLVPVQQYIGSVWLSILFLGLTIIAALRTYFGYTVMALESADEVPEPGEGMETVSIPDIRNEINRRLS
jgi:PKD repeat protein